MRGHLSTIVVVFVVFLCTYMNYVSPHRLRFRFRDDYHTLLLLQGPKAVLGLCVVNDLFGVFVRLYCFAWLVRSDFVATWWFVRAKPTTVVAVSIVALL